MSDPWMRLVEKFTGTGEDKAGDGSQGWIQWKGTDVCMDVHCVCGESTHLDCDFAYLIQCGACKRVFWPTAYIRLVELKGDDLKDALACDSVKTTQVHES